MIAYASIIYTICGNSNVIIFKLPDFKKHFGQLEVLNVYYAKGVVVTVKKAGRRGVSTDPFTRREKPQRGWKVEVWRPGQGGLSCNNTLVSTKVCLLYFPESEQ